MTINHEYMPEHVARLLDILRNHPGRNKAISMAVLYEKWSGTEIVRDKQGKALEDVATISRGMRKCIDDLRDLYGVPVMSSAGAGYWIVMNKNELDQVRHEFRSRGIKSLQTAARLAKNSLIDEVNQLALDLKNDGTDIAQTVRERGKRAPIVPQDENTFGDLLLSPESKMAVITNHIQDLIDSPEQYAEQVRALQNQFGPHLIPHKVLAEVRAQISDLHVALDKLSALIQKT